MKRLIALAVVLLNLIAFSAPNVSSTKANTAAAQPMAKPGTVALTADSELDFTIVNKTGYNISALYIGPSSNKEWTEDMEVLHGRTFPHGGALDITFSPKARATRWDIMVEWEDDYENTQWLNLKLTEISKVTLTYNRKTGETFANVE